MTTSTGSANQLSQIAATPLTGSRMGRSEAPGSWFEALADAWGQTLDQQAARIEQLANGVGNGGTDNPSQVTQMTAEALRMNFLSNASHTSIDSVGKALETMARKG
jgi:hypothetical protein